jgi:DNA-binding SARP family transcriptional activator
MEPERVNDLAIELRLLGPLDLLLDEAHVPLGGAKPRALLACLALHIGEVVSVDRLVEALWGEEAPDSAAHAVQVYVSQLRKALGVAGELLARRSPGYALELRPEQVDVYRFERLVDEGRHREALALWRGRALADFTYEPFAQIEIARLEEVRQLCLERRIEDDLASGRDAELVGELETLVAAEPLRERLRGYLMLALYRSGRQSDALAAYRAARQTLIDELGVEPGPELRALEAAILRQDDTLVAQPLQPTEPVAAKRKLVTILFAGLAESMQLARDLDPEALDNLLGRFSDTVHAVVDRHGGTVETFAGGATMVVFGVPAAHEDDALRAARAAVDLREAAHGLGFAIGVGLESGEVLAGDPASGRRFATGEVVGVASALHDAATGGIAVGPRAARLLAHAAVLESTDPIAVRGRDESVPVFRLSRLMPSAPTIARSTTGPFVGRHDELKVLTDAFAGAVAAARAQGVLIVGAAGIGKSRLAEEFARTVDAVVLQSRCPSYGEGITYEPLHALVPEGDLAPILAEPSPGETALAFRRHCEELARERPLIIVLDDLQWAEPSFLDLVQHLVGRGDGPILVVGAAREELLEDWPEFLARERLALGSLARSEAEALLAKRPLSEDGRARIVASAEGNPLFLEQLAAFAVEEGGVQSDRQLPETVQALLTARLDRLGPGERAVLERAAVVGREFTASDVASLVEPAVASTIGRHLEALAARRFVHADDAVRFSFAHGLIKDAVYRATPKADRAKLHARFADRLEGAPGAIDELVGYHLEQAHKLRSEVGAPERALRQLAVDAGARLGAAGMRAWKRADVPATLNLLGRATALLPPDAELRGELLCELGIALRIDGDVGSAEQTFGDAVDAAGARRDRRIELRAGIELAYSKLLSAPESGAATLLELVESAIPVFETLGDDRALGRGWLFAGFVHGGVHGHRAEWEHDAERSLVHYRRAGWPVSTCLGEIAAALYYGPAPVERASKRCRELLDEETATAAGRAGVLAFLGGLVAMRGAFDRARAFVSEAAATYAELGMTGAAAVACGSVLGDIELLAGDPAGAEAALTGACLTLERLDIRSQLATRAADLAEALYRQARYAEAERWAETARTCSAEDDRSSEPRWRSVTAKLLARTGELHDAELLGRQALRIAAETDALNQRARVLLDVAEAEALAGRPNVAHNLAAEAESLCEAKGNVILMAEAGRAAKAPAPGPFPAPRQTP